MKRLLTILFVAVSLAACSQSGLEPYDPNNGGEVPYVKSDPPSLDVIPDPGTITEPIHFFSRISWDEWRHLNIGLEGRIAELEVPAETLKEMTTLALVKSVANYPMNYILSAYNNPLMAVDIFFQQSALFQELASRENAEDILIWAFGEIKEDLDLDLAFAENADNLEWLIKYYESNDELDHLRMSNYYAFLGLSASDHFDFSKSQYFEYFKVFVKDKIYDAQANVSSGFHSQWFYSLLDTLREKYSLK